jgi:N-acetylglucosaminyl-diphospho-decaprenol L-rhamnosyltransferase
MIQATKAHRCTVSVLMVGYNSGAFLAEAVGAVGPAVQHHSHEVRFVDNGTDGSEGSLGELFPHIDILPSRGNIGFGAANNYLAQGTASDWLLMLNPDTVLHPHAIDVLLEAAQKHPRFEILGGISVSRSGEPLPISRLKFPTFGSVLRGALGFGRDSLPSFADAEIVPVDAVSGGFLLVSRTAWERLGGFDERFFLYAEELDLCRRHSALGGQVGLVPGARMIHEIGSGDPGAPQRVLFLMRGTATYFWKHFSWPYAGACLILLWLSFVARFAVGALFLKVHPRCATWARSMRLVALKPWRWISGYR